MSREDIKYWIKLNMIPGVGSQTYRRLVEYFGSPKAVLNASLEEFEIVRGITTSVCHEIVNYRENIFIDREMELIERHNCDVITIEDDTYPFNLKNIYDPPPIIYIKGEINPNNSRAISVVGSRNATQYGKSVAEWISNQLASQGIMVISGMAHGIDTAAHNGALDFGGNTIAVVANGLDIVYPPENIRLYERIINSGAVISELPMGTKPHRAHFPKRNRIISGMSLGTIIVEASSKSGALITADFALEQGREVFAVPGQIFSEPSKGTHELIKQGAKLVDSIEDIINELPSHSYQTSEEGKINDEDAKVEAQLSQDEKAIWNVIKLSPIHIDDISRQSNLPIYKVSSVLVMLELKGLIRQLAGKMFVRKASSL